VATIAANDHP